MLGLPVSIFFGLLFNPAEISQKLHNDGWIDEFLEACFRREIPEICEISRLTLQVTEILKLEPNFLVLQPPFFIVGDLRGQLYVTSIFGNKTFV